MTPERFGNDRWREAGGVVGTQDPTRRVAERDVEQHLVPLALGELLGTALRSDRFTDAAARYARMVGEEALPHPDDPTRVATDCGHVREAHRVGRSSEPGAQPVDLRRGDHDHHRLVLGDAVGDERRTLVDELLVTGVEQCLVAEPVAPLRRRRRHRRVACGSEGACIEAFRARPRPDLDVASDATDRPEDRLELPYPPIARSVMSRSAHTDSSSGR